MSRFEANVQPAGRTVHHFSAVVTFKRRTQSHSTSTLTQSDSTLLLSLQSLHCRNDPGAEEVIEKESCDHELLVFEEQILK